MFNHSFPGFFSAIYLLANILVYIGFLDTALRLVNFFELVVDQQRLNFLNVVGLEQFS